MVGRGFNTLLGFGRETTWGTAVIRTIGQYVVSEGFSFGIEYLFSESLRDFSTREFITAKKMVTGSFDVELVGNGQEAWWKSAFGNVTTTNIGGGAYRHTFTLTDALPSLSVEVKRDIKAFLYSGVKVNEVTVTAETGAIVRASFGIVGKEETILGSPSTLTIPSPGTLFVFTQGSFSIGGVSVPIRSFDFTMNNGLTTDRMVLGSSNILEPVRTAKIDVTGTITLEYTDDGTANFLTEYTKYLSGTTASIQLIFTGPIIGGGNSYQLEFVFEKVVYTGTTPNATSTDIIVGNIPFRALLGTETYREVYMKLINTTSSVI